MVCRRCCPLTANDDLARAAAREHPEHPVAESVAAVHDLPAVVVEREAIAASALS